MENLCWAGDKGVIWTASQGAILRDGEHMGIARPELVQEIARLVLPERRAGTVDPDLAAANLVLESRLNETEVRLANLESRVAFEENCDTHWMNKINGRLGAVEAMVRHLEEQIREVMVKQAESASPSLDQMRATDLHQRLAALERKHSELFKATLPLISLEARVKNVEKWLKELSTTERQESVREVPDDGTVYSWASDRGSIRLRSDNDILWCERFDGVTWVAASEDVALRELLRLARIALANQHVWTGADDEAQIVGEG